MTSNETTERREFQAEVKQLLDLMIHSLYSNKEVFLRELISNASDALDKRRYEQLSRPELATGDALAIQLVADAAARTLTVSDNGVGMSKDEVIANIGTIAKSGTKAFLEAARSGDKKDLSPELIGQFGVGFYAAFMVADKVELVTRRLGEAGATRWVSVGDGGYELAVAERAQPGTTITLHLKPADPEHGLPDFTSDQTLRATVRRYSDFVAYPIRLGDKEDALNSQKAIWDRAKGEVTDEEYQEFYRHVAHDWQAPWRTIPVKMEGTIEANALMFIPTKAPFDLYNPEMKRGLALYVKRVFVMDECKDLLPPHLRFIKGVVDAHDLSLNVSREILQKDRQIQIIRKQLVKKILATLEDAKQHAPEDYHAFWAEFGPVLKEGLMAADGQERDKLLDLVLAPTTASSEGATGLASFANYVARMKPDQDAIYVLTGAKETIGKSPLLEAFAAKGYEVLLFSDAVDEMWLEQTSEVHGKKIVHIGQGEVQLGSEEERKAKEAALQDKQRDMSDLLACLRVHLQDEIKEVRLSGRLTSSPACLVGDEGGLSPRMQRLLEQMGQKTPKVQRILELNPDHPLIPKLKEMFAADSQDPRLASFAHLLLGQAHLADSGQIANPALFGTALADVMAYAVR